MKRKDSPETESYKDAVWDFILEHCDITENGSLFVKFHTPNRTNFENRIIGRWIHNYHRGDPRQKEAVATEKQKVFTEQRESKKQKYKREKAERRAKSNQIKAMVKWTSWYNDLGSKGFFGKAYRFIAILIWKAKPDDIDK